jgi:DNA-directed RNA polymerase subunit RPC12/RpoP
MPITPGHDMVLGTTHVRRSAHLATTADAKAAYFGQCLKCPRPVRAELEGMSGRLLERYMEIRCPDCATPLRGERLFQVSTETICDESCMHAFGPKCTCGCYGQDHGRIWGQKLKDNELLERELGKWREHVETVRLAQEAREATKETAHQAWRALLAGSAEIGALRVMLATHNVTPELMPVLSKVTDGIPLTNADTEDGIATLKRAGRK